jgi:hypothetical protein
MDERELFPIEIGRYLDAVSEEYPVGVCSRCGSLRARTDVNPKEACPAKLFEQVYEASLQKDGHEWKAATSRGALEAMLAQHFGTFKSLSEAAASLLPKQG